MDPDWSIWVHDLKTGARIAPLTLKLGAKGDGFSIGTGGDGTSTTTVVVGTKEDGWTPEYIDWLLKPNDRMIARWWGVNGGGHPGDQPLYSHKIEDWDYDRDKGLIKITAVDVLGETNWRMIGGADSDKQLTLTVFNRTPAGAVAQVLTRMMQWSPDWAYPLDLPANAPGWFTDTWIFWKGYTISQILDEIRKRAGVEIYLRSYATPNGGVRFQVRVGAPITIGGMNLHLDAEKTPLSGVHYRKSGAKQVTGLLGLGNGTGEIQEFAHQDGTVKVAIRDTTKDFGDLVGDALQEAVDTYYKANVDPINQWDIGAFAIGDGYAPEMVAPGRLFNIESHGDPVIPDGVHTLRVISVAGDNGRQLKPEVQVVREPQ